MPDRVPGPLSKDIPDIDEFLEERHKALMEKLKDEQVHSP